MDLICGLDVCMGRLWGEECNSGCKCYPKNEKQRREDRIKIHMGFSKESLAIQLYDAIEELDRCRKEHAAADDLTTLGKVKKILCRDRFYSMV